MKITRVLANCVVAIMAIGGLNALADEESKKKGLEFLDQTGWFKASAPIQDLRERSMKTFELLDENDSGSITLEEIDLSQFETDMSTMNPTELQQNRQRINAIRNKFMNWSEEINEFEVVDTNNDGYWSEEEYEARGDKLNLHRLELGIEQWDKDGNGAVELHEFNSHLDELELLDEDGDGTVSRQEAFNSKNSHVISDVLLQQLQSDAAIVVGGPALLRGLPGAATGTSVQIIRKPRAESESN